MSHISGVGSEYSSTVGRRTLPIGVAPVAGEALESWLATLAKRLDISWGDLLALVLPAAGTSPRRFHLTTHLDAAETVAISAATGVEQTTVRALTLARFDGTLLTIDRTNHRLRSSSTPQRSRYCPRCLQISGARWQLTWRLPWVFACDEHASLLADTCPTCGQFQRVSPWWLSSRTVPELERCIMTRDLGGHRVRCDGNLSAAETAELPGDHPIATAQARLSEVLSTSSTDFGIYHLASASSLQVLADLRVLAARYLAIADAENIDELLGIRGMTSVREQFGRLSRTGRNWTTPNGFATTAPSLITGVGITLALSVLGCATLESAAAAFRPIIKHARASQRAVTPSTMRWGNLSAALKAVQIRAFADSFTPIDELRYRTTTILPCYPSAVAATALSSIPTYLWRDWTFRLMVGRFRPQVMSPVLAVMVLSAGRQISALTGARLLKSDTSEEKIWRIATSLHRHPLWPNIANAIIRLADYLTEHPSPIDYQRRRQLDYRNLLPTEQWHEICDQAIVGSMQPAWVAPLVRSWLYERLSMQPAEASPFAQEISRQAERRTHVIEKFTAEVVHNLDTAVIDFLNDNNIFGEPLTWSPPLSIVADLELPGPDPTSISIVELHNAVSSARLSMAALARHFQVPTDVVRYLLECSPPAQSAVRTPRTQLDYARTQLAPAAFSRMYQKEHLPFRVIASRLEVHADVVSKLAHEYGIEVRDQSKHRRPVIDPDWIYREYVVKQRTISDLAREAGVDISTMSRRAKQHGIAVWRNPNERPRL